MQNIVNTQILLIISDIIEAFFSLDFMFTYL